MARAIVLGANGFIGRHVVAALLAQPGTEVVGAGLGRPLDGLEAGWMDADLATDEARFESALRALAPSLVVNCAGATSGSAVELLRANVITTAALLGALDRSGVAARLVHLGSAAEYGPGETGVPVAETVCPRPRSDYGIAKLAATQLVLAAAGAGRDCVVLRVFNALGPDMPPGSLPGAARRRLEEAVVSASPRVAMGPLGSVRDFVDVRDIASAVLAAWRAPNPGPLVNVGSGSGHSARELVDAMAAAIGFHGVVEEAAAGSPRSADVPWQVADVSLAARRLGWRPVHDLRSSVELMIGR